MIFGSVCSGIEAASVAWDRIGWRAAWFAEIEPFPCSVLAHHWPHVPNLGDMTKLAAMVQSCQIEAPDILVGGTPCQAFSVAGLRKGLDDERGQLTIRFVELADEIDKQRSGDECVVVWENVPGVLSSKDNAFGCFLGALAGEECELQPAGKKWSNAGCVFGPKRTVAWRVLDAQYFGVAQRRRRVFVVASARNGFDPGAVLFESDGLRRDTPPSRETGQVVAALTARGVGTCGADDNQAQAGHIVRGHRMVAFGEYADDETASTMKARDFKDATDFVTCSPRAAVAYQIQNATRGKSQNGLGIAGESEPMYTLDVGSQHGVAITQYGRELAGTLTARHDSSPCHDRGQNMALDGASVRRLTPVECERLQGFPDNHTRVPWRGKAPEDCPDGPRYKAIGNSMAVPVMRWIGERIKQEIEK